jgi:hypothetical protein
LLDHLDLNPALLEVERPAGNMPSEFAACLNALGSYTTERFVLRLSPRIHQLVDAVSTGIYSTDMLSAETIQAYSTYLHETVHWWQHIGSSAGLVLSLVHPAQAHQNSERLIEFIQRVGRKKSIKRWAEEAALSGETISSNQGLAVANFAVNNAIDLESYKVVALNPNCGVLLSTMRDRYFESVGHCYWMAYGHVVGLLQATVDREGRHLPDGRHWDEPFRQVRAAGIEGWVHGEPVHMPPFGLYALFEGQARLIQLQYLTFGVAHPPTCEELQKRGYFNGVYGEAFKFFLETTASSWPRTVDDPVVALFLLVVDLAINPTAGFPLDIESYENFILNVDPGIRFLRFTQLVAKRPELLKLITRYSREEYFDVAGILVEECGYDHPAIALQTVAGWPREVDGVAAILKEKERFRFDPANLVMRVLFSHYVSFYIDKLARPEFFCWPGAWMAGERVGEASQRLFLKYLSLFTDRADSEDIVPRMVPGAQPADLSRTLSIFYTNITVYDLTRQWILQDGPFRYRLNWLSQTQSEAKMAERAASAFESAYGVHPEQFDVASSPHAAS